MPWHNASIVKCVVCRKAEARAGTATKILESGGCLMIITGLPADMCAECEEKGAEDPTHQQVRVRTMAESCQLRERADVLWREVEAVVSAAWRLRRVWRRDDGDPARR